MHVTAEHQCCQQNNAECIGAKIVVEHGSTFDIGSFTILISLVSFWYLSGWKHQ